MLQLIASLAPKEVLAGVAVWGGLNYFLIGPEMALRVVRVDYLPACEEGLRSIIAADAQRLAGELSLPQLDPAAELAFKQLDRLRTDPLFRQLSEMSGGLSDSFGLKQAAELANRKVEQAKRAARDAYEANVRRVKREAEARLADASNVCGCVAGVAIAETQSDWALLSGTLGIYSSDAIRRFDDKMSPASMPPGCTGGEARS